MALQFGLHSDAAVSSRQCCEAMSYVPPEYSELDNVMWPRRTLHKLSRRRGDQDMHND